MQHARIWYLKGEGLWAVLRSQTLTRAKRWRVIAGNVNSQSIADGCVPPSVSGEVVPAAWLEVLGELSIEE